MKANSPKRRRLLNFHRPQTGLSYPLANIKPESRQCLTNLANYTAPTSTLRFPNSRSAAVLVALFIGRMGDLYVLLSRRASTLRTYAGDTSLPGGKWERGDQSLVYTARREAFEEIGLPMDRRKVPFLCTLEPFLAGNQLIVTPVVVLVLDQTVRPILNASEVDSLFSHPLFSFLRSEAPFPSEPDTLELKYHTYTDIRWSGFSNKVRMHRFLTGREAGGTKPIFGLTASILIRVATIGYALAPNYELEAPGQPSQVERIEYAIKHHPVFREASLKEGLIQPERLPAYAVTNELPRKKHDNVTSSMPPATLGRSRSRSGHPTSQLQDCRELSDQWTASSESQPRRGLQFHTSNAQSDRTTDSDAQHKISGANSTIRRKLRSRL